VSTEITGQEDLDFVFNPRYIIDGINAITSSRLAFCANESVTPVALRMVDEEDAVAESFVYIIMPIRN
jgi:DNA polymerase III sliding clamp (beta) subunit (PCNA family)